VSRTLVVGLGNTWRGDDGAGPAAARRLEGLVPAHVRVLVHEGEPTGLIDVWDPCDEVVVIDAIRSGAVPGTVRRLEPLSHPIPAELSRGSTHVLGLSEVIELARALDRLPRRLFFYGIEGEDFTAGSGLAPAVEVAVDRLCGDLAKKLGASDDA
jgi:hydrogenase maturation protease